MNIPTVDLAQTGANIVNLRKAVHSAALNGSWCGGKQQLSAANGRGISKDFPRQW